MKFRTEIQISPLAARIDYRSRTLCIGSCFAEHIAERMAQAKFAVTANPTGIVFNPLSIAAAIRGYAQSAERDELCHDGEVWFHYGFHSDFSAPDPTQALARMNAARQRAQAALQSADTVVLTLGTAWVYELQGGVVANCHRTPAAQFIRRRLSVQEIVATFDALFTHELAGKQIILTVSPVRHLGDGLEGNSVSKATLRLAAEELTARHAQAAYFPAYEILCDDLRDYRFYADDLVHPSRQAVDYVWEKFTSAALTEQAQHLLPEVQRIVEAAAHRPRNPQSEAHRAFCRSQMERIASLSGIDFAHEEAIFGSCLK